MSINYKKLKLPDKSGVYFFLGPSKGGRKKKEILYIGKATSLRDRVRSYFANDVINTRGLLIVDMVFKADRVKFIETDSVLEALILEASLIKKHKPKYNTKEKDNKSFNYVCITREKLPRVIIKREREIKNKFFLNFSPLHPSPTERYPRDRKIQKEFILSSMFGPFTNGGQLKEALKIIRPIFPYLDEKSKNHYNFYKQVNLVPDINTKEGIEQYKKNIKNLKLFFEGKKKKIIQNLKKEMQKFAKERAFEKAGATKRQIFALEHINDVALLKLEPNAQGLEPDFRIEAFDVAHMGGKNMVGVMAVVENSEASKNEYKKFKIRTQENANDTGALREVLERRFNHPEWGMPDIIVVDGSTAQINIAKNVLSFRKLPIKIVAVVKDERHKPKGILLSPSHDLKGVQGRDIIKKYEKEILLANSEAHRFAIAYHKNMRSKNFLK